MKKLIAFLFIANAIALTVITNAHANDMDRHGDPRGGNCPATTDMYLEVISFAPSADSRTTKGTCIVKVHNYFWYDLVSTKTEEKKLSFMRCDSKDIVLYADLTERIPAQVSYKYEKDCDYYVDDEYVRCMSKLGIRHSCVAHAVSKSL